MSLKVMEILNLTLSIVLIISTSADCSCDNSVRLVGGKSRQSGRLEVCRDGRWNTMCDQRFNSTDATVVCRELGFSDEGARPINRGFQLGYNSQQIWRVDTVCNGTETSILDCPTRPLQGFQRQFCSHSNDVGVSCQTPRDGELRILGGCNASAGRLEVFHDGRWGTVCQDYWSRADAQVACRQLGFSGVGARAVRSGFKKRSQRDPAPIWLDNVQCSGREEYLLNCTSNQIGRHNCDHSEDSGVVCQQDVDVMELLLRGLMTAEVEAEYSDEAQVQMEKQMLEETIAQGVLGMLLGEE